MRLKNSEFGKWEHKRIDLKKVNFKENLKKKKGLGYNWQRWQILFQNTLYHNAFDPEEGEGSWIQRRT